VRRDLIKKTSGGSRDQEMQHRSGIESLAAKRMIWPSMIKKMGKEKMFFGEGAASVNRATVFPTCNLHLMRTSEIIEGCEAMVGLWNHERLLRP
jgi:hypothetical protein